MAQKKPLLFLGGLWALVDVLRFACKLVDGKAGFVIGSAPFAQFPEGFESYFFFFCGFLRACLKSPYSAAISKFWLQNIQISSRYLPGSAPQSSCFSLKILKFRDERDF